MLPANFVSPTIAKSHPTKKDQTCNEPKKKKSSSGAKYSSAQFVSPTIARSHSTKEYEDAKGKNEVKM